MSNSPVQSRLYVGAVLALLVLLLVVFLRPDGRGGRSAGEAPAAPVVRELRLGLNIAAGSALHAAALRFAEASEARSQGRLRVKVFPDQQLGSDDQMLEQARGGQLDLLLIPTAKLSAAIPAMQYPDLPFFFQSREELYAMLDGEPGRILLAKLGNIDLVGLTFWENGFKQFTANTPIRSPRDFAGLRIRTMKSPLIAEQFASMEARPIPIDFHATHQALRDGAVDGQENPLVAIVGMRFHEVQKHLTLSNHAYLGYVFAASRKVFEDLSPDLRDLLLGVARELTVWERAETARREGEFIRQIEAAGVAIHPLSDAERRQFAEVMRPVADEFGLVVGYDLIAKTEELRLARTTPEDERRWPLIIGLNADLSSAGAQAGGAIYRGIEMAIAEINRQGGLLGRPLKLIARDHAAIPQIGRRNIEFFAGLPDCIAVVGGMHSSVIVEELADIHRLQMPYLIPWAAAGGLTRHDFQPNYTFRVSISDKLVVPFLLTRARQVGKRPAILLERSAWGRSNEEEFRRFAARQELAVDIVWVDIDDQQVAAKVKEIVASGHDVLIMATNPPEARAVVRAMAQLPQPIPVFAHWGLTAGDFFTPMQSELARVDLRFVQSILMSEGRQAHPRLDAFLRAYRQRYGLDVDQAIPSPIGTVHAHDLVGMLAAAVRQARTVDRGAIRTALENLPRYSGLLRQFEPPFDRQRHDAQDPGLLHLARFDARGHIVSAD